MQEAGESWKFWTFQHITRGKLFAVHKANDLKADIFNHLPQLFVNLSESSACWGCRRLEFPLSVSSWHPKKVEFYRHPLEAPVSHSVKNIL